MVMNFGCLKGEKFLAHLRNYHPRNDLSACDGLVEALFHFEILYTDFHKLRNENLASYHQVILTVKEISWSQIIWVRNVISLVQNEVCDRKSCVMNTSHSKTVTCLI
jgi:hypothetical protein